MRIIVVSQDFPPDVGGIQTYTIELARRFATYTTNISVIAPKKKFSEKNDKKEPYKVHRIPSANTTLPFSLLAELPIISHKEKPEIVFHTQWQTVIGSLWTKKWHHHIIVTAVHARELFFTPFPINSRAEKLYLEQMDRVLNQIDHFFPVSNFTRQLLLDKGIPDSKITLFNNGTDPEYFKPVDVSQLREKMFGKNRRIIMTMARLVSMKGIDTVLGALNIIRKDVPEILYLILGDGPYRKNLERIVIDSGLENHVMFIDSISDEDRVMYYNMSDIYVMPSKIEYPDVEGFGIVFLEASACEKPVIGSRTGGILDAIDDGKTGLLVEQSDPVGLAHAMMTLLKNLDFATMMGKQGRKRVVEEANWDFIGARMFKKLNSLKN